MVAISFMMQAPAVISRLYYKSFMIVIYNHNDDRLYYDSMNLTNLGLARSVNYNRN
jgi:hypothetical protein